MVEIEILKELIGLLDEKQKKEVSSTLCEELKKAIKLFDWNQILGEVFRPDTIWDNIIEPEFQELDREGGMLDSEWVKSLFRRALLLGLAEAVEEELEEE